MPTRPLEDTTQRPTKELSQSEVLQDILLELLSLRKKDLTPLVIFDIDDTLLSTLPRHLRILKEFTTQPELCSCFPKEAKRLASLKTVDIRYSITDTARSAGVMEETLLKELLDFWFDRFFKNEFLRADDPVAGAPDYCQEVIAQGSHLVYLTGRDEAMREGTLFSLSRHGFPMPNEKNVRLILKPKFETPDAEYKSEALEKISEMGEVAAVFENEPSHINFCQERFPQASMVFVDTHHSGKPVTPHSHIPWIKNFLKSL
ncbi:MAG: hypothetical protein HY399_02715 [Elusimicrobia bacterium]|nr:hypothetical protein [Elusimicrobiota bacterium]